MRKPATLNTSAEGIFNAHKHHDLWDEIKLIFDEAQVTHFLFSQMAGCSIYTLSSGSGMDADDFQNGIFRLNKDHQEVEGTIPALLSLRGVPGDM